MTGHMSHFCQFTQIVALILRTNKDSDQRSIYIFVMSVYFPSMGERRGCVDDLVVCLDEISLTIIPILSINSKRMTKALWQVIDTDNDKL